MAENLFHRLLIAPLPYVPKPIVWRFSQRYVAGIDVDDAIDVVARLNAMGCSATIDVLGEDSTTTEEVDTAQELYFKALEGIAARDLDCNASVKLSDMGLRFDHKLCFDTMEAIVARAAEFDNFVRIDMEDSSVTSVTLDLYRRLRERHDNVGTVVQSCLHRSEDDVQKLLDDKTIDFEQLRHKPLSILFW